MTEIISDIILVDSQDQITGFCEKLKAHQAGLLHRAFSVFIYRQIKKTNNNTYNTEILLQKRHAQKYHSGGLWTNTCCSHPAPHENIIHAAQRRLKEELGIDFAGDKLKEIGVFHYTAPVGKDLIENEIDHVLIGKADKNFSLNQYNPEEISELKWIELDQLNLDLKKNPQYYTAWFAQALEIFSC